MPSPQPDPPSTDAKTPALLVACVALLAGLLRGPRFLHGDTWFSLLCGQQLAARGWIDHDTVTWLGHGAAWEDPQWLAHLAWWGVHHVGGVPGVWLVRVLLSVVVAGLGVAWGSRALRSPGRALPAGVLGLVALLPVLVARGQSWCEPLFLALLVVLDAPFRRPVARAVWLGGLLVVWANVHPSVVIGSALVVVRAALEACDTRCRTLRERVGALLPVSWALLAPACTVRPGLALRAAWRGITDARYRDFVLEWQPVSLLEAPTLHAAVLPALAAAAVLLFRARRRPGPGWFPALVLAGAAMATLHAERHAVWLGLTWIAYGPGVLDAVLPDSLRFEMRSSGAWRRGPVVALAVLTAWTFVTAPSIPDALERTLGPGPSLRDALRHHVSQGEIVFVDETVADWVVLALPGLEGRITHDARIETLSRADLESLAGLRNGDARARAWALQFPVLLLDAERESDGRWLRDADCRRVWQGGLSPRLALYRCPRREALLRPERAEP